MADALATPQDIDAEESVLGAMLISGGAVQACLPELDGEHFYRTSYGTIYETMRGMYLAGTPIDCLTLTSTLERAGRIGDVGGRMKVLELAALVPAAANALHYARIVRAKWAQRRVQALLAAQAKAVEDGQSAEDVLAALELGVTSLHSEIAPGASSVVSAYSAAEYLDEKIRNPLADDDGIPTPWSFTGTLMGGRVYILGGYQKDGKTSSAMHFVRAAAEAGKRTGIVSLEMRWEDVADRLASVLGVGATEIQRGHLLQPNRKIAEEAVARIAKWPVEIIDDPACDVTSLRRYQRLGRYEFLVIDHLHRFRTRAEYRRQDIEAIVTEIVNLAREERIPVLLLVQLSRASSGNTPYPRPALNAIRETGMAEAEAAVVWFLWRLRDERHLPTSEAEWITAANRYGKVGYSPLHFNERTLQLSEGAR